jgi:L-aspartate oxidase
MKYNIDITADLVPIRPAAHYAMGGVATDLHGATSIPGLFAAGEVASTGVHGANRLASNSLLEGLVFGGRSAAAMLKKHTPSPFPTAPATPRGVSSQVAGPLPASAPTTEFQKAVEEARAILWDKVAIIRDGKHLSEAVKRLNEIKLPETSSPSRQPYEACNILTVARLIARCALAREESRGAHYRSDFPLKHESFPPQHSYISKNTPTFFSS